MRESTRTGRTAHVYAETRYAAATWNDARRVVIKAEVVRLDDREPRDNPRFVVDHARAESTRTGRTAHVYAETRYAAATWNDARRVVIKAEVVRLDDREPRDNPRFVVTNLRHAPRYVYERVYCARGDIENRIKELLDGLQIDRTSCCRFWANQLRVLMTAAAYVLMQELRLRARAPRAPAPR